MSATAKIDYCSACEASLTSADDEHGACSQCRATLPPLRVLLRKIAGSVHYSYIYSNVSDEQAVDSPPLTLGDVRLARELLG